MIVDFGSAMNGTEIGLSSGGDHERTLWALVRNL
jgi:hypothetical protein